ncbi:MAG: NAD(P)-binding protein, partial [Sinobacteraceae bacterium]|nr:NAD(P)-binding protein [Nevskiaceae bacterium]
MTHGRQNKSSPGTAEAKATPTRVSQQPLDGATEWSDAQIDAAVNAADPMALRGLLYYLTADEEVARTKVKNLGAVQAFAGFASSEELFVNYGLWDPEDVKLLRARAVTFLKRYREQGDAVIAAGADQRRNRSLCLTVGEDIPSAEVEMWGEELALDPMARALKWKRQPTPKQLEAFSVVVIGAGMGGLNAAVMLKEAGIAFTVIEKNVAVGGTWLENAYPGARLD